MLTLIDITDAWSLTQKTSFLSLVSHNENVLSKGIMLEDFIFNPDSLNPEQENEKYKKWKSLSFYAKEIIKLLIENPENIVWKIIITPNGHLIRKDAPERFFCLLCGIIGFDEADCAFEEINIFMKDFSEDDIPDFRIEK